ALTASRELAAYFEAAAAALPAGGKLAANWVLGEVAAALHSAELDIAHVPVSAGALAGLLRRVQDGTSSAKIPKDGLDAMWAGQGDADAIIAAKGLKQISDADAIGKIVDQILAANPAIVAEYRAGKAKAFNSLIGKAMQATQGKANPSQVNAVLKDKLG